VKEVEWVQIDNLMIHPIRLRLTFVQMPYLRSKTQLRLVQRQNPWVKAICVPVLDFSDMVVQLNSFIVPPPGVLESSSALSDRIQQKTINDIKSQLISLAGTYFGNMTLLGKPAGLAKNVGGGVKAFFYEPIVGLQQSPQAFAAGLASGSTQLFTKGLGGLVGSTMSIVGAATSGAASGAAFVAGDSKVSSFLEFFDLKIFFSLLI
jgi:hypothetical protein